jgi:nicotinate phosphoribosyltransferase
VGHGFRGAAGRRAPARRGAGGRPPRQRLDAAGLERLKIIASSGLDEYRIRELLRSGAPIDGFGVGTDWAVSADAPDLDFAYKLTEYDGRPRMKASEAKLTYPGVKQVWRRWDGPRMAGDLVGGQDETPPRGGDALLRPVIDGG